MRIFRFALVTGVVLLACFACNKKGGKYIDEGEIHFRIEYVTNTGSMSQELKPQTMVVSFKRDKYLFEILSPIGNQGIMNIVNPQGSISDTYINMLAVRYYYSGKPGEIHPGFGSMEGMNIRKTSRTMKICGYNCKNIIISFPSEPGKEYEAWYTDEIRVKNSTASTPYSDIDGVLLSFYYKLGNSLMQFEAQSVYSKEISDKAFERKSKYKLVSKEYMEKIISSMVNL